MDMKTKGLPITNAHVYELQYIMYIRTIHIYILYIYCIYMYTVYILCIYMLEAESLAFLGDLQARFSFIGPVTIHRHPGRIGQDDNHNESREGKTLQNRCTPNVFVG